MGSTNTQMRVLFKGVDKTGGTVNKMRSNMISSIGKVAGAFAGMFAVKAFVGKSKQVVTQVHAINDEARQVGAGVEFFQKLGNAFGQVGLDASIAGKSLDFMRRNLATKSDMAGNIFEQMGLSAQRLKSMGTEEMFLEIGREIAKLPNEVDKVKATYEIFGRSGSKLVPLFRQGPEAFMEGLTGVMDMMPAVSKEVADSMSNIDDTFAAVKQTIFVDWADALFGAAKVGEDSFGRVETAIFATFLKVREFSKGFVAMMAWLKDSTVAIFSDDTLTASFNRLLGKLDASVADTADKLEAFKKGLEAKDTLAGLFDGANNGAAELKRNIKAVKDSLTTMTLAGTSKAIQAQFRNIDVGQAMRANGRGMAVSGIGGRDLGAIREALVDIANYTKKTSKNTTSLNDLEEI